MNYKEIKEQLKSKGITEVYACGSRDWSYRWSHDDYYWYEPNPYDWEPVLDYIMLYWNSDTDEFQEEETDDPNPIALVRLPSGYYWDNGGRPAEDLDHERQNGNWAEYLPYNGMTWNGEYYCDGGDDTVRYYPVHYGISKYNNAKFGYIIIKD